MRIEADRLGKIREWAAGVDCDCVRVFVDHADQEVRGIFGLWFECRIAFGQRIGNFERSAVDSGIPCAGGSRSARRMDLVLIPSALVSHLAVKLFPASDLFLAVD